MPLAADATPEDMTAKAIRNVTSGRLKALCTNSAAPPACGYLDTSSAYDAAVNAATTPAAANAVQNAPPTLSPTSPTSA